MGKIWEIFNLVFIYVMINHYLCRYRFDESYHSNELQWAQTFLRMKKKIHSLKR